MPQPINYFEMIAQPDPGAFMAGVQQSRLPQRMALQEAAARLEIEKQQRENSENDSFQREAETVISNPSADGFRQLLLRYPRHREALTAAWNQYTDGQQRRNTEAASSVYAALTNSRPDLALTTLRRRREALTTAGEDTTETDALIAMVESNDPQQIQRARGIAAMVLATATGPEHLGTTLERLHTAGEPEAFTLGPGETRYERDSVTGEQREVARSPLQVRSFTDPATGITYDLVPNEAQPGTGAAPAPSSGAPGASATRGVRNNNPGNVEDGAFARAQPGYRGTDGRFAIYETPEQGIRAQEVLLRSGRRYFGGGRRSVSQIINAYLGNGRDNSAESRRNYIAYAAQRLSVSPNEPLDISRTSQLAAAMREFETGARQPTAPIRVRSVQEARALPPGTVFITPDGRRKVR